MLSRVSVLLCICGIVFAASDAAAGGTDPKIQTGRYVDLPPETWRTVMLDRTYNAMVVVATPNYGNSGSSAVIRIRNASGNTFEMRADPAVSGSPAVMDVYWLVMEEGVYTDVTDGFTAEAATFTSTVTGTSANGYLSEAQTYQNTYTNPVVVGQVMTYNDANYSAFFAHGSSVGDPPDAANLNIGKSIGNDPTTTRADETIGYVVIETGTGTIGALKFSAGAGANAIAGIDNAPPYTYALPGLTNPMSGVVGAAGINDGDGGWPILFGADPLTATTVNLAWVEDEFDAERSHPNEQVAYIVFEPVNQPNVRFGVATDVDTNWTTVVLPTAYHSMVIAATANYTVADPPALIRIRNAFDNQFEIRVSPAGGADPGPIDVHYIVMEEGVYNTADHGFDGEAQKYLSTVTDRLSNWNGEDRGYRQPYTDPVVVGEVMTQNDARFSYFWAYDEANRANRPDSGGLATGKSVGGNLADPTRDDELIGYIVAENGTTQIGATSVVVGRGSNTIQGVENVPPYVYTLAGPDTATVAVTDFAGMNGNDGGWSLLYGSTPITATELFLAADEDQAQDAERGHTREEVAYFLGFGAISLPEVVSVIPVTNGPTNATSIDFTVSFTEDVVNFDGNDLQVNHTGTAGGAFAVSPPAGPASVYTVTVSGLSGSGSFTLEVVNTGDVADLEANPLGNTRESAAVILDNTPPTAVCFDFFTDLLSGGTVTPAQIDGGSFDESGGVTLAIQGGNPTFGCDDIDDNPVVTLVVTDEAGNESTCDASIIVIDNIPPVPVCQDVNVNLSAGGQNTGANIDAGSSDTCGAVSVRLLDGPVDVDCANLGVQSVTLIAEDESFNTAFCTANVTIVDDLTVEALCQDLTVNLSSGGAVTAAMIDAGSHDPCNSVSLSLQDGPLPVDCASVGENVVTLIAESDSAATATCDATVTIIDDVAPAVACRDITLNLDETGAATLTAADIDDGTSDCEPPLLAVSGLTEFGCSAVGQTVQVMLLAEDATGNTAACVADVTIADPLNACSGVGLAVIPLGDLEVEKIPGESHTFAVEVTGATGPVALQWKYEAPGAKVFTNIDGANGLTLTLGMIEEAQAGQYICEATDTFDSAQSPPFTLTVSSGIPALGGAGLALLAAAITLAAARRRSR